VLRPVGAVQVLSPIIGDASQNSITTPFILDAIPPWSVVNCTVYVTSVADATDELNVILLLAGMPALAIPFITIGTDKTSTNIAAVTIAVVRDIYTFVFCIFLFFLFIF
jgi:hypothetical protein